MDEGGGLLRIHFSYLLYCKAPVVTDAGVDWMHASDNGKAGSSATMGQGDWWDRWERELGISKKPSQHSSHGNLDFLTLISWFKLFLFWIIQVYFNPVLQIRKARLLRKHDYLFFNLNWFLLFHSICPSRGWGGFESGISQGPQCFSSGPLLALPNQMQRIRWLTKLTVPVEPGTHAHGPPLSQSSL